MTLTVRDLAIRYDDREVVSAVAFDVGDGEIVAVLGASGSGKSTILRAIAGLVPAQGVVAWGGNDLSTVAAYRRGIGMMFQDHALFGHIDVVGNVEFGLKMQRLSRSVRRRTARELLALVGLVGFERRSIASMSGGEQQRVALARALAPSPRVLLLDEPFGALDRVLRERLVIEVAAILRARKIATVVVTHDHNEAFAIADRVVVLNAGRVEQIGSPASVWSRPASLAVCELLGFAPPLRARAHDGWVDLGWARVADPGSHVGDVDVVLRPDAFVMADDGPLRAEVLTVVPFGDRMQATVRIVGGPVTRAMADADSVSQADPGREVRGSVRGDAVLVFPVVT